MPLIHQKQSDIFEKVVQKNGKLFRVRFVVIERNGILRGKVISCEEVISLSDVKGQRSKVKSSPLCLPVVSVIATQIFSKKSFSKVISPFSEFDFLTSIQIRAPAFK